MRLLTYRIENRKSGKDFRNVLRYLYNEVLNEDSNWHFFRDELGTTLRFTPKFRTRVETALIADNIKFQKAGFYNPNKDEYEGVCFVGDHWLPIFHVTSIANVMFPPDVVTSTIAERMNHALVNQAGIHNFFDEAQVYTNLALMRAQLGGAYGRGKWYDQKKEMPPEDE